MVVWAGEGKPTNSVGAPAPLLAYRWRATGVPLAHCWHVCWRTGWRRTRWEAR